MAIDTIAYAVKYRFPTLFGFAYTFARAAAAVRHGRRRRSALGAATLSGHVGALPGQIRPLDRRDVNVLHTFFARIPHEHLRHFHPHGVSQHALRRVVQSPAYCCYGLFVDGQLSAYGLLKLAPWKRAYMGRLVLPDCVSRGMGKFLSRYLSWQSYLIGVVPGSTIHKENAVSLASHRAVRPIEIVEELPGGFYRVLYPVMEADMVPPVLELP